MKITTHTLKTMSSSEKATLKDLLRDHTHDFSEETLQAIIDNEFFNDDNDMDAELIDAAARRLAQLHGLTAEEQYKLTAHQALMRFIQNAKKPSNDLN